MVKDGVFACHIVVLIRLLFGPIMIIDKQALEKITHRINNQPPPYSARQLTNCFNSDMQKPNIAEERLYSCRYSIELLCFGLKRKKNHSR
jgi:hypothetical protein